MGNSLPTHSNSTHQYFSLFEPVKKKGEELLLCRRTLPFGKLRETWEQLLVQLKYVPNQHIMVPRDWRVAEKSICGTGEVLQIQYDHYASNLAQLIDQRATASKYFEQSQLWYVMYALSEVGVNCKSLSRRVGDIRPHNVLLNRQGQIKVLTFLSFPNDINPFAEPEPKTFFSPQQLQQRKKGYMQNCSDPVKNQSFSMGVTLLSMALLQNAGNIYNRKQEEIDQKVLQAYLSRLRQINYFANATKQSKKYSNSFCQTIQLLLRIDEDKRLGYNQLFEQIQPYIQQIEDFQPFTVKIEAFHKELSTKTAFKQCITLKSRHRKGKLQGQRSSSIKKVSKEKLLTQQPTVIESRFVGQPQFPAPAPPPMRQLKTTTPSSDLLRQIDQKLRRSREQFPS